MDRERERGQRGKGSLCKPEVSGRAPIIKMKHIGEAMQCLVEVYRDVIICICVCICLNNKIACLYICIWTEARKWAWFIPEVKLNQAK